MTGSGQSHARGPSQRAALVTLVGLLAALALIAWQRAEAPRAFFSGDEGVKSAQRAALAAGHEALDDPSRAFATATPGAGAADASLLPWRPPFVVPCAGGVCSVWRNPVVRVGGHLERLGGPPLAALLSWVGLALWAWAAALLARRLGAPAWPVALALVATTPAWLYGVVLWEHAPAAAIATLAMVWALPRRGAGPGDGAAMSAVLPGAALPGAVLLGAVLLGALSGLAALSRPESALIAAAAWVAATRWRRRGELAAFALAALAPLLAEALLGGALQAWLQSNAAMAAADPGLAGRGAQVVSLLAGVRGDGWPQLASLGLLALALLGAIAIGRQRRQAAATTDARPARLVAALTWALLAATAVAATRLAVDAQAQAVGLLLAAPAAAIGWLARLEQRDDDRAARMLALASAVGLAIAVLVAPNDGGSQWGPRYLLPWLAPGLAFALAAGAAWRRRVQAALVVGLLVQLLGARHFAAQQADKVAAVRWLQASPAQTLVAHAWYAPQELASLALDAGWDVALADSPARMAAATRDLASRRVAWWVLATAPGTDVRRAMDGRSPWRWVGARSVSLPPVAVELHLLGTPEAIEQARR